MDSNPQKFEITQLVEKLVDGSISESEFSDLKLRLATDPAAVEHYFSELEIDSLLFENFADQQILNTTSIRHAAPELPASAQRSYARLLALAATLLLGAAIGYFSLSQMDQPVAATSFTKNEITQSFKTNFVRTVARVTNGNEFACSGADDIAVGSWLIPGKFELTEGDIEVTFDTGTTVAISSPSVFEIVGVDEIRLINGNLEADVPEQAIGFRVHTPSGEIVDLSTKFAVNVDEKGGSDIHVIEGLVEALPNLSVNIPIVENSSIRMLPDSAPEAVDFAASKKPDFGKRQNRKELKYVHFSFDDVDTEAVANLGNAGGKGLISSSDANAWFQVAGKLEKSVFFSGKPANITAEIGLTDGLQARTISYWTRVMPRTDRRYSTAFSAWSGSDPQLGGTWQLGWNPNYGNEGELGAIRMDFGGGYIIGSTDLRDTKWHHITSVFLGGKEGDDMSELVRHYVDGKLEKVSGFKSHIISSNSGSEFLTIGEYIYNYKGWLDEVYVFDTALTPAQINRLMKENKPPQASEIVPDLTLTSTEQVEE